MSTTVVILLIVAGLLLLLGAGLWLRHVLRRGKRNYEAQQDYDRAEKAANAPRDPLAQDDNMAADPLTLQVGQSFEYAGTTYAVRGTLRFREGPDSWTEHFLDSGLIKEWLSVEKVDGDLELVRWQTVALPHQVPGIETMVVGDVTYELKEGGTAAYTSEGTTGLLKAGVCDYFDYIGPGDKRLSFERYDHGKWEAGTGEVAQLSMIQIYPAGWSV